MRKVAFLVANDTFPEDPSISCLRFTENDARELADVLEDPETCGFEARPYLNETSQKILSDLDEISRELTQDDTLLFYYSGHGKLSGNELCLVSKETRTARLRSTSIKASDVLGYLQDSSARRRILVLDCCHSGAMADIYRGGDAESALSGLAHSYGTCILTASTAIQLAEEREKDGHGVFTKALIDCLREPLKERITVDDWYNFAFNRLKISGNQTPRIRNYREGDPIEIGSFKAKHERLRREQDEQLISTARIRLNALVASGALTEPRFKSAMRLLESDETTLFPYEQDRRDKLKRYLKGELDLFDAFGNLPIAQPPPELPAIDRPVMRPDAPLGPRVPISRSVTLLVSATLAVTALVFGVVFTEKAGQFLHQALSIVSISGGMPAAAPNKTPGVPAATPAKTSTGPEVIEVQGGPAGSDKPEVLAAAERADEAARAKAAADSAAKDATAARATESKLEAKLEAPVSLAKLVPDDIRQALYHRGHALLIGVADYTTGWDKQPDVKNDLNDLKEGLAPHFETVETMLSPTVAEIRTKMRDFLLGQWNRPNERLFIYYSGAGFTAWNDASRQNDGYITGSDTPLYDAKDGTKATDNAVQFGEVNFWNTQTRAKHVLMVFDSSFSGSLFGTTPGLTKPTPSDIRRMLGKPIRYYITAGSQNEEVSAGSTFAKLLLRGLRGEADMYHQGIISADDLGNYLYHEVPKYSPRQTPQFGSIANARLSEGQFFFLIEPAPAGTSAPLAKAPAETPDSATAKQPARSNNKSGIK